MSIALLEEAPAQRSAGRTAHEGSVVCRHASSPRECDETDHELKGLAQVQRLLLPEAPPEVSSLDLAVSYRPARLAGGDYYDFFRLSKGRWGILIADVSGHGAPAALGTAVLHATARAARKHSSPAALLRYLNRQLAEGFSSRHGNFITAAYVVFDPKARLLTYSMAGHPAPRLRRGGNVISLDDASGLPLGIDPAEQFGERTLGLEGGDALLLFTDGVTEARGVGGEMFGTARLDEALMSRSSSAAATVRRLLEALDDFNDPTDARDDRTLVLAAMR